MPGIDWIGSWVSPDTLRLLSPVCSIVGSILLSFRVKRILDALRIVAVAHEANIQQLMSPTPGTIYNFSNSTQHVERAKGTGLMVVGFLLLGLGGLFGFLALLLTNYSS